MKKHDEGYVMLLVVVVILVLSIVSAALMSMTVANLKNQRNSVNRMQEKYSAQGELEKQLATIAAGLKEESPAEIEVKYQNNKEKLDAAFRDSNEETVYRSIAVENWLAAKFPALKLDASILELGEVTIGDETWTVPLTVTTGSERTKIVCNLKLTGTAEFVDIEEDESQMEPMDPTVVELPEDKTYRIKFKSLTYTSYEVTEKEVAE